MFDESHDEPSLPTRVYHLEREAERLADNAHRDRGVLNATLIRVTIIEAKNAIWGAVFGAAAAAFVEILSRHL